MNATITKTDKKVVNKTAKTTTKIVNVPTETKVQKVNYLAENVTGKALMKSIYKANNDHKTDLGTFSQCLKRAIEFGAVELASVIKDFNVLDMTPKNLIPLRNEKKTINDKFSVYEVLMLTKKFYKTK